jgi:hypothetical protein
MENGGTEGAPRGDGPTLKRGSVQPGCILLGGPRLRSTAIRFFKFVWYFQQQVLREFFLRNGSN